MHLETSMTPFDYVVLVVLGVSVLVSVVRGATREVISLLSWIGATVLAVHLAPGVAVLLPTALESPTLRIAVGFIAVMISSLLVFALISLLVTQLLRKSGLSSTDRTLGAVFGLLRGVVILVVLVLLAGLTPLPREPAWRNATFSPPLEALAIYARGYLPPWMAERIQYG